MGAPWSRVCCFLGRGALACDPPNIHLLELGPPGTLLEGSLGKQVTDAPFDEILLSFVPGGRSRRVSEADSGLPAPHMALLLQGSQASPPERTNICGVNIPQSEQRGRTRKQDARVLFHFLFFSVYVCRI